MRVLVVAAPLVGHLTPLLPLAGALRVAGHEVLVATGGDAAGVDTGGIPVQDVTGPLSFGRAIALPAMLGRPRAAVREIAGRAGTDMVGELFGRVAVRMASPVLALARRWRPAVVLFESLAAAGPIAAQALGVAAVLQESNLWDGRELLAATLAHRGLHRHGAGDAATWPMEVVTIAPPSLVGPRAGRPMRAVPDSGAGELPDWLAVRGDRPRVLVSRSTVGGPGGDPTAAVLAAARRVDAEFVLVRGPQRRSLPDNVRSVGWIPLDRAMARADALVHHGGAGGLLQALAAGIPQLVVPGPGDRRHNAELVDRRGAGLAVPARRITADVLDGLVSDPALRRAAHEVRDELAAMPAPADLVPVLEDAAGS